MIYNLMLRIIENAISNGLISEKGNGYVEKLSVFYINEQITTEEYNDLLKKIRESEAE